MNFDQAFEILLEHEGGYVNHPSDPGGETKYGITEAVARGAGYTGDMRRLSLADAKKIYRQAYWDKVRADELQPLIRYLVFDSAVHSGVSQAIRWLQFACDVSVDGKLGPVTIAAANDTPVDRLKRRILSQRLRLMTLLPQWGAFGRGWARRVSTLLEN